jgi:hypothetical protein
LQVTEWPSSSPPSPPATNQHNGCFYFGADIYKETTPVSNSFHGCNIELLLSQLKTRETKETETTNLEK